MARTNTTSVTLTADQAALIAEALKGLGYTITPPAPAPAPESEFVSWLRDTAEARKARKATNKALSAALRTAGVHPAGAAWDAAKAALAAGKSTKAAVAAAKAAAKA